MTRFATRPGPIGRAFLALALLTFGGGQAPAASPSLGAIQPRGAQRGTEAVLTFTGARLADAQEVLVYYPGIRVTKLEVVNDGTLKVTVAIAPDCRLGEHAFRVRTATGVSDLRTFWVGALPVVDEKEPNSDFDKPQPIPLNVTVHGVVDNEDQDYFVVECRKGQRLSVEVEGMRLGTTFFDPYVAILDAKRFELATSDDSPLTRQDGGCSVVIPEDGRYVVLVRESAYGGNGACQYRLHVGTFPRPTAVLPAGGKPGEEVEVTFLGDPTGPITQKVRLPADDAHGQWRLHCQTPEGVSPTGFPFRLSDLPNVLESPGNTTPAAAAPGPGAAAPPAPVAFNGILATPGEVDYFKFTAKKGQVLDIHCYARRLGSPLDPVLFVGNASGAAITGNDDAVGPDSYIRVTIPEDGTYTLWVHDHLRKGGPDSFYRIEVTPVAPSVTTLIPRVDGNNPANQDRQTIAVPRGGRYACLVVANRADFGGPLAVGLGQVPAGVRLTADVMDPGLNLVPVVFEAAPDAPLGGWLTALTATPTDPNVKAPARTALEAVFTVGPGNTIFARHLTDRVAVAVTEPAPYRIEVVEPKVPIVQNGVYNLKVIAHRAEGFKGPITVFPLWTPPGLGIQGSATIPEGANECLLPMNAAPNAAVRKWKTVVHAVADAGKGPVWTASQLFTLEVAPPLVTLAMDRPAVEQGKSTELVCKVTVNTPFEGTGKVTLYGLPAKVTSQVLDVTKDTKELVFPIHTEKDAPAGKHGGIFAQVVIETNGERITGNTGGTELRIDVPLPPKTNAPPPPMPPPTPQPMPNQPPPRRLSRLEQLRLEQQEREKAAASPPAAPEPKK